MMVILDVEASSLGESSYPIEIGWVDRYDPTKWDQFLVKPEPICWTDWDLDSQEMHGISREELWRSGISPVEAVESLTPLAQAGVVYCDRPGSDLGWLARLYRAAGREEVPFRVRAVTSLISPSKGEAFWRRLGATEAPHRALGDVKRLIKALNYFAS